VYVEPFPRRVRAVVADETVIDCEAVLLVHRAGGPPVYAFPDHEVVGVAVVPEPAAPGYVTVAWDAADAWFEEEEETFLHARNPYHRVDYLRTTRRLRVEVGDAVLVDTTSTTGAYETALAPRLYVARDLVRTDLLVASATTSFCPYKGTASYWHAVVDGVTVTDVAWSYDDPFPESEAIRGMLSFYEDRARVTHDLPLPG
jgi:uncharacterized protein (DUF427 family)